MASKKNKPANKKPSATVNFDFFDFFKKLLVLVGKPIYLIFSYLVIALFIFLFLIGFSSRSLFQTIINFLKKIPKFKLPTVSFPKLSLSQFKIPPIHLPKIKGFNFKPIFKFKIPKVNFPKLSLPKFSLPKNKFPKILFLIVLIFGSFGFLIWNNIFKNLPSPHNLLERQPEVSTKIYDRNNILLYTIYKDKNRTPISLSSIPLYLREATLAAEDAEFYNHPGISIKGILRAVFRNTTNKDQLIGGSTITQQLVKNTLLTPEKTLIRKIKEVVLAFRVEMAFSKDQIFEMYLNEVSYGGTAYGIQEAAHVYFGKELDKLTLAESALLAGLPKSPTQFSPFGPNPNLAFERQQEVLRLMFENGFITREEKEKAQEERLTFSPNKIDIKAPHFVMFVRQYLEEKYGHEMVEKGGLTVTTSLDYKIQQMAEAIVKKEIDSLVRYHVTNGAAIVLDPTTGDILAMVGSHDYFDLQNDGNVNVTTSLRQPGSSIKVVNYAYALSHGFTASTMIVDSPVTYPIPNQANYTPKNYDNKFRGLISLRSALAESRNIPAVKVLASYGVDKMIELGRKMGISTWKDPSRYGLSLTLGGGETKLIDLAQVFATVANMGQKPTLRPILKITNYKNQILEKDEPIFEEVLTPSVSFLLIDILKDNLARTPAFGSRSSLVIPNHPEVAVKTGTSNDLRDNLTIGFNQKYLTAVWVGNNDNSAMRNIASGITGAAPIWNNIMRSLLEKETSIAWIKPADINQVAICSITGTLSCQGCPTKQEFFIQGTQPKNYCRASDISRIIEERKKLGS